MDAWYLVYSKAHQERKALQNLQRQDYCVYLPQVRTQRRSSGRYKAVVEPMFPRYLLIRLSDESDDWGPIRSTLGVSHLVRFGGVPARVPSDLVSALRARDDEDGVQELPEPGLHRGEGVRIVDGPMAGYEAIFEARSGNERVVVLLSIAQRAVRLTLRRDALEALKQDYAVGLATARAETRR